MKYAILIYDENTASPKEPDPEMAGKIFAEYNAFTKEINAAAINLGGQALQPNPTATKVRWYGTVEVRPVMSFEQYEASEVEHKAVGAA